MACVGGGVWDRACCGVELIGGSPRNGSEPKINLREQPDGVFDCDENHFLKGCRLIGFFDLKIIAAAAKQPFEKNIAQKKSPKTQPTSSCISGDFLLFKVYTKLTLNF